MTQREFPVVLTVHDHAWNCLKWLGPQFLPNFLIAQYVLHRAWNITTVSPYLAAYLEKKLGRKVPVIPNVLSRLPRELGMANAAASTGHRTTVKIASAINWSKLKNGRRALQAFQIAREGCLTRGMELRYSLLGPDARFPRICSG